MGCGDAGQERTMGTRGPRGRAKMDGQSPMINTQSQWCPWQPYTSPVKTSFFHI